MRLWLAEFLILIAYGGGTVISCAALWLEEKFRPQRADWSLA